MGVDVLWRQDQSGLLWLRRRVPGGFEAAVPVEGAEWLEGHESSVWAVDYDGDGRATWMTRDVVRDVFQANELVPCPG